MKIRRPDEHLHLSLLDSFNAERTGNSDPLLLDRKSEELLVLIAIAHALVPEMQKWVTFSWISEVLGVADTKTNNTLAVRIRKLRRQIDGESNALLVYQSGYGRFPRALRLSEYVTTDIAEILNGSPLPLLEISDQPRLRYIKQFPWSNNKDIAPALSRLEEFIEARRANLAVRPEDSVPFALSPAVPCIGRNEQINELMDWLDDPEASSLRTIVAPPGYGKTYLAREVAHRAIGKQFRILFLPLHECATFQQIVQVLEQHLLVPSLLIEQSHTLKHVALRLSEKKTLLVLDGLARVLTIPEERNLLTAFLHSLLSIAPSLRLLALSHSPLAIPIECIIRLLPFHSLLDTNSVVAENEASDGVRIILAAARMTGKRFSYTAGHYLLLEQISEKLGGIPLFLFWAGRLLENCEPSALLNMLDAKGVLSVSQEWKHHGALGEA